jgi:CyaY protein
MLSRETMTTDSAFIATADATLAAIGAAIDAALAGNGNGADNGTDWSLIDGILEIECSDGSKLIVNRHVPNREIWVAARSGGFHFRADGDTWRDRRSGGELATQLKGLLRDQAGLEVDLTRLPPPPV